MAERMEAFLNFTAENSSFSDWCKQDWGPLGNTSVTSQDYDVNFWTEGVFSTALGAFGVAGNITTVIVLTRAEFRETFHRLLISLAAADTLFILCNVLTSIIRTFHLIERIPGVEPLFLALLPLGSFTMITSMYITVSISIERYFGICYPIQSRVRGGRRLLIYLIPVILFSLVYSLPRLMEIKLSGHMNTEITDSTIYDKVYKQYIKLTFSVIIPLLVLLILNIRIFMAMRQSRLSLARSLSEKKEISLASILLSIVIVFFACHSFRFIEEFYRIRVYSMSAFCSEFGLEANIPRWIHNLSALAHPALVLNSSANIVIYCLVGTRFRAILLRSARKAFRMDSAMSRDTEFVYLSRNRDSDKPDLVKTTAPRANPRVIEKTAKPLAHAHA